MEEQRARVALEAAQAAMDRQEYETAVTILENLLFEQPGHVGALFNLAYCYNELGRTADAIDMYRQTLEVAPNLFEAHLNLGFLLYNDGQAEAAAGELKRAVEVKPDDYRPHFYLGKILEELGKKEEALEHYRRAAALDTEQAGPRRRLLALHLQEEDWTAAEGVLEELLTLQPENPELLLTRAELLHSAGKKEEALEAYEAYFQAVAANPSTSPTTLGEMHLRAGWLARELGKAETALHHFEAARREGGDHYKLESLKEQADTLLSLERFQEAIPLYREAAELQPAGAELRALLGYALFKSGQYPAAVPELLAALQLDPTREETYNHLAAALTLSGNLAGAIQVLDRRARYAEETSGTFFLRARNYDKLGHCGPAIEYYEKFLELNSGEQNDQYFLATGRLRALKKTCREQRRR